MENKRTNSRSENRNGQDKKEAFALRMSVLLCPACPQQDLKDRRYFTRGQHIIEYALLLTTIAMAFSAMFIYGKRGLQGVIRQASDSYLGPQKDSLANASYLTPTGTFLGNSEMESTSDAWQSANIIDGNIYIATTSSSASSGNSVSVSYAERMGTATGSPP